MNIAQVTKACLRPGLWMVLFLGTTLGSAGHGYAGFQDDPSYASAPQNTSVNTPVSLSGPKTSSLEVFNDRYVPDTVRQKYNLEDSWFGKDNAPATAQPTAIVPNATVDMNQNMPLGTAMPVMPPLDSPTPVAQAPKAVVESWRGRKGENVRDVLQRWAARSGANLMWASANAPVLQKEFTYIGKFQDAVNALLKTEDGQKLHSQYRSEGLNPVMMAPASTVTTNTPPPPPSPLPVPVVPVSKEVPKEPQKDMPPVVTAKPPASINPIAKIFQPEEKKDVKPETRWFALSGAPLAEVMKVWAEDAGVRLIWQSERNFAVKESISQIGHFEDAVFRALDQYSADEIRPVGEMYKDPQSGQSILLVRTEVN
ncbi:MAG TPA: hypothetical protein DCM27_07860 [Rhodospirillaceae bacterium]|nr:hypothetical protein [Rhodospirillaceae bacterium]